MLLPSAVVADLWWTMSTTSCYYLCDVCCTWWLLRMCCFVRQMQPGAQVVVYLMMTASVDLRFLILHMQMYHSDCLSGLYYRKHKLCRLCYLPVPLDHPFLWPDATQPLIHQRRNVHSFVAQVYCSIMYQSQVAQDASRSGSPIEHTPMLMENCAHLNIHSSASLASCRL